MLFVIFTSVGAEEERIIFDRSITEVVSGGSVMVTRRVDLPYPVKAAVAVSQVSSTVSIAGGRLMVIGVCIVHGGSTRVHGGWQAMVGMGERQMAGSMLIIAPSLVT